ncbi:C39 family peptidase [Streptomyces sp. NPDC050738]|uniref:C39 family peptidase n=1 Tax=Streptomyces sp. NPDC050738 TaxID=3154744 RepID=UPI0034265002
MPEAAHLTSVPYYAQWESADLVDRIVSGELPASADPLWPKSGAESPEECAYWSWRLCGMACLRMALDHWKGTAPPAVSLAEECLEAGAYVRHEDGRLDGLIYAPFAEYARTRWSLSAECRPDLPAAELPAHLAAGGLAMLSVHPSIRELHPEPPHKGGHLVLAVAADEDNLYVHNPSGFPGRSQRAAAVPWPDLDRFYAGRGVFLGAMPDAN